MSRDVVDIELAGYHIFGYLLETMMDAMMNPGHSYSRLLLSRVPEQYDVYAPTTYGKIQCALDYISGMTDVYALDLYRKITGQSLPAVWEQLTINNTQLTTWNKNNVLWNEHESKIGLSQLEIDDRRGVNSRKLKVPGFK